MAIKKFLQNGGMVKSLLIILVGLCGWLLKLGFAAGKYDSRLCTVEATISEHSEILKAIPPMKEDLAGIRTDIGWIKRNIK